MMLAKHKTSHHSRSLHSSFVAVGMISTASVKFAWSYRATCRRQSFAHARDDVVNEARRRTQSKSGRQMGCLIVG